MKNVFVVTSTRAEYGLLKPVISALKDSESLQLKLMVTGTHLAKSFGSTIDEIEKDGFAPDYKVDILKFGNDDIGVLKTISYTIQAFGEIFAQERPDLVVLLGDRYEIFAVATACSSLSIPIAHISGGDVTAGAKDDFYRHCITKMSSLHFPSCNDSYKRLLRLGEDPKYVYNVGGLGDENIRSIRFLSFNELEKSLEFSPLAPFALITYHPETQNNATVSWQMEQLLQALDSFEQLNLVFTKANADAGGQEINSMIDTYCQKNSHRAKAFFSLGLLRYLSAMKYAQVVIGNSSSGVVETPTLQTPCVNIGDRQKGRYIAENVISVTGQKQDIKKGIRQALSPQFKAIADKAKSPYYNGCITSQEIVKHIKNYLNCEDKTTKKFYDGEN